ncbi:MAG: hypothetical protein ABIU84_02010, partial [Thermoanaerobaculia bacterium]
MPAEPRIAPNYAWSGTLPELVAAPAEHLLARLIQFIPDSTAAQQHAWRQELDILHAQGAQVLEFTAPTGVAGGDSAVLEYMLPREAGRRPDVLLLQNGRLVVMEFKEGSQPRHAALDQVQAYALDLAAYHEGCEGLEVLPVLVLCGSGARRRKLSGVEVVPAAELGQALVALGRTSAAPPVALATFLAGEYEPLPTLVAAARLLFDNLRLPFIKRAQSAGVHAAVAHVIALFHQA